MPNPDPAAIRSVLRAQLHHDPDGLENQDQAGWAVASLEVFALQFGHASEPGEIDYTDPRVLDEIGGDLIAALCHLAYTAGLDPDALLRRGHDHYLEESS